MKLCVTPAHGSTINLQGVHVNDIAVQAGVSAEHLGGLLARIRHNLRSESLAARLLRYLATRHVFREVAPDVFANNRISSMLIKKHSVEEIKEK